MVPKPVGQQHAELTDTLAVGAAGATGRCTFELEYLPCLREQWLQNLRIDGHRDDIGGEAHRKAVAPAVVVAAGGGIAGDRLHIDQGEVGDGIEVQLVANTGIGVELSLVRGIERVLIAGVFGGLVVDDHVRVVGPSEDAVRLAPELDVVLLVDDREL